MRQYITGLLAVVMVIGGIVLFAIDKFDFVELVAFTSPPVAFYFGMQIPTETGGLSNAARRIGRTSENVDQ